MSTLTKDQTRALGVVADRVLAAEAADEEERQAEAARVAEAEQRGKDAFHAYIDARERYAVVKAKVEQETPTFLALLQESDAARADQDYALRIAQKSSGVDLPPKVEEIHGIIGFKQSDTGKMLMRVSRMRP